MDYLLNGFGLTIGSLLFKFVYFCTIPGDLKVTHNCGHSYNETAKIFINNNPDLTFKPDHSYVYRLIEKFEETGSVLDKPRSGRPLTALTDENTTLVLAKFSADPQVSSRKCAQEVGLSQTAVLKILKKYKYFPFKPTWVHPLYPGDFELRVDFANCALGKVENDHNFYDSIIWTDEAKFFLNGRVNRQNTRRQNVFIVTNDDKVFAFGSNPFGMCGFGHYKEVATPQEIPELNGKQIKQFFIGRNFVLALNENNHVFGWGWNYSGQLGIGYKSLYNEFLKPAVIPDFENIIEICCGYHILALDKEGNVFSWGNNIFGQVGCGKESGEDITRPIQLKELPKIKSIHCYIRRSFAVTFDGLVYSWGQNKCCLGRESRDWKIIKPELISELNNVLSVGCSKDNTYFLTNEGNIYFCGKIASREDSDPQLIPKILETDFKFQSLQTVYSEVLALSEETVYCLKRNSIQKTKYKTVFDYCLEEVKITFKTTILNFSERFQEMSELGSGQFGKVLKVKDTIYDSICALKKIKMTQNNEIPENRRESLLKDFLKEVIIMSKCKSKYVVKYFESKVENNCLYIVLELFDSNLEKIIKEKNNCFERTEEMTVTEYFICSQIMKEILECVQYLHKKNIIHRDLKPANILVNYEPKNNRFLKICDFGISTHGSDITMFHTRWRGTPEYTAPEVMAGTDTVNDNIMMSKYSTKVDVYSLGKIIYKLFDFQFFSSKQINSINKILKQKWMHLEKLIDDQMLAHNHKKRPTCAQILENTEIWSISKTELQFVDLIECENQFIKTYLEFKINETKNSIETNWINKLMRLNPFS